MLYSHPKKQNGSNSNQIGGVGAGNLIAGNRFMGLDLQGNLNTIEGNFIGVLMDSVTALPNGRVGIQILGGENNRIGGDSEAKGNIIAGRNFNSTNDWQQKCILR